MSGRLWPECGLGIECSVFFNFFLKFRAGECFFLNVKVDFDIRDFSVHVAAADVLFSSFFCVGRSVCVFVTRKPRWFVRKPFSLL